MTLFRGCRESELGEGQKILREAFGYQVMLSRVRGKVYCTDAHCFHMGTSLLGGDIEECGGHPCVVCPAHRYRISLATGQKMERSLEGPACPSRDQKQRTYRVHPDGEFIWVHVPEARGAELPSDYYNQKAWAGRDLGGSLSQPAPTSSAAVAGGPTAFSSAVFGAGSLSQPAWEGNPHHGGAAVAAATFEETSWRPAEPLEPYGGFGQRPLVPSSPSTDPRQSTGAGGPSPLGDPSPASRSLATPSTASPAARLRASAHFPLRQALFDGASTESEDEAMEDAAVEVRLPEPLWEMGGDASLTRDSFSIASAGLSRDAGLSWDGGFSRDEELSGEATQSVPSTWGAEQPSGGYFSHLGQYSRHPQASRGPPADPAPHLAAPHAPSQPAGPQPGRRPDPPHVARRKRATAAVQQRAYAPPTRLAAAADAPGQRTLLDTWGAARGA